MISRLLACIFLLSVPGATPEVGATLTAPLLPTPAIQCVDDSTKELAQQAVPSSSECNDLVHSTRCEAVLGMNLTLVCPVCQNHSAIKWKHSNSSVQLSNYTSYNITLQGNSSVASGCYTCECTDGKRQQSCKFPTEVRPKVVPYLKVPNCSDDGQIQLCSDCSSNCPASHSMDRSSTGTLSVNCSSKGWPTPDVTFSVSYNGETQPLANASVPGLCFKSTDATVNISVIRDFGLRLQGVEVLCHVGNIFGHFDAIGQIVFDGWHDYFITSIVDTSTQSQVNYLHDGVGTAVCGGYTEDDIQFSYQLCIMGRTSDDVCEASLECCDCQNCTNPAMLAATGITSLAYINPMGRQVCSFNVSKEARLVCKGRRDNVAGSANQSLSTHVFEKTLKEKQHIGWSIPVASSLGGLLVVLVVVLVGCTVYRAKRQKGDNIHHMNVSGDGVRPDVQQAGQGDHSDVTNVRRRLLSSRHYEVSSYGACSTSQQEMKLQFVNTMTKENIAICPANPEEVGQIVLPPGLYHLEAYGHEWKVYVPGKAPVSPVLEHIPCNLEDVTDYVDSMASKWSRLGDKLGVFSKVATLRNRQESDEDKCLQIIESAVEEGKLKSWTQLLEILRSDAMKMSLLAQRIEAEMSKKYGKETQDGDSSNDIPHEEQETSTS